MTRHSRSGVTSLLAVLLAACGEAGTGAIAPGGAPAKLGACPTSLTEPLFNTMPMQGS